MPFVSRAAAVHGLGDHGDHGAVHAPGHPAQREPAAEDAGDPASVARYHVITSSASHFYPTGGKICSIASSCH